jgi:hypothetical protein
VENLRLSVAQVMQKVQLNYDLPDHRQTPVAKQLVSRKPTHRKANTLSTGGVP